MHSGGPPGTARVAADLLRAQRAGRTAIAHRQRVRLAALVAHARTASAYYRRHHAGLPTGDVDLAALPPVTKPDLMAAFDDWVTDPAVTRAGVESFMAGPGRIGTPFLGRYLVCRTSGTTGVPGLLVHDRGACRVYRAFTARIDLAWLSGGQWLDMVRRRARWASVVGTGGHFAGEGWMELQRRQSVLRRHSYGVFSLQQPLPDLVASLNAYDPAVLTSYPSALEVLAGQQRAGRLRLRPVVVEASGESTDEAARARIAEGLGGVLHEAYAASECLVMAFDCAAGWLHVNSDWVVLEPVGADHSPTPPGEPSATVLLTNLANRVQPLIRYDLRDSVLARPDPCPCGNPLPAIRVEGRRDDVLRLRAADGRTVDVPPLAVAPVVSSTPGVRSCQLVQTGPAALLVRLELATGAEPDLVWDDALRRLRAFLTGQGATGVELARAAEPPRRSSTSGKLRHVVASPDAAGA